jgi:hypothetical protein
MHGAVANDLPMSLVPFPASQSAAHASGAEPMRARRPPRCCDEEDDAARIGIAQMQPRRSHAR